MRGPAVYLTSLSELGRGFSNWFSWKEFLNMRPFSKRKLTFGDLALLLALVLTASLLQGPVSTVIASGPTLPPAPWEDVRVASGPTLPPAPWEDARVTA